MRSALVALLVALVCSITIGIVGPGLLLETAATRLPGFSDALDDTLYLPAVCTIFLLAPLAAGAAAYSLAKAIYPRLPSSEPASPARTRAYARITGLITVFLSWLLFAAWSIRPIWFT
jgi:hypothetical protein